MGNICCLREKKFQICENQEEKDLSALIASKPTSITLTTIPEAILFLEKNLSYYDFHLKIQFPQLEEPYEFSKMIDALQYCHFYKRISLELGPFLTGDLMDAFITSLSCQNSLEFLELILGENQQITDNQLVFLGSLIKNSICFNLKEFRLEFVKSKKISTVAPLIHAINERNSLTNIVLKLADNNLNDGDFEVILQILDKKALKFYELDVHANHAKEKTAKLLIEAIEGNRSLEKGVMNFKENKFTTGDMNAIKEAAAKKKDFFTVEV